MNSNFYRMQGQVLYNFRLQQSSVNHEHFNDRLSGPANNEAHPHTNEHENDGILTQDSVSITSNNSNPPSKVHPTPNDKANHVTNSGTSDKSLNIPTIKENKHTYAPDSAPKESSTAWLAHLPQKTPTLQNKDPNTMEAGLTTTATLTTAKVTPMAARTTQKTPNTSAHHPANNPENILDDNGHIKTGFVTAKAYLASITQHTNNCSSRTDKGLNRADYQTTLITAATTEKTYNEKSYNETTEKTKINIPNTPLPLATVHEEYPESRLVTLNNPYNNKK